MSRLGELLEKGHIITFTPEVTAGFFADLRDDDGRVVETGLGVTREEAEIHLGERLERYEGLRFSDDVLDERVTDLEEVVTRLDERTGASQELLIKTLSNAVTMLQDSGLWKPTA